MATIPPGGIVTVPDPISGGAGAPVTTTQIVNAMWENAQNKSTSGDERVTQAIALADPAPQMLTPVLDTTYVAPLKPILPEDNPLDGEAMYETQRDQMV